MVKQDKKLILQVKESSAGQKRVTIPKENKEFEHNDYVEVSKILLTMVMCVFLLTTISALYAGESTTFDLGQDYSYYSVVGNSSEVVLDIQQNGTWVIVTPDKYSIGDTYELIFFDTQKEIITVYTGGGGGSSRTIYKDRNVTEYIDKIIEKEVVVNTPEKIREIELEAKTNKVLFIILILIIMFLLFWILYSYTKKEDTYNYNNTDTYDTNTYDTDTYDTNTYDTDTKEEDTKNE